jgi:antitoxin HicB
MEPNINNNNESELIDETETVEEIDIEIDETIEAAEAGDATEDRPRGRGPGRRGMYGRRPFGPNRPYRFALFVEEDGSYVLRSPDLEDHSTPVASLDEIGATMRSAIEQRAAEDAAQAAEAAKDAEYSGKFVLRLPHSMHRQLAELAEAEGVSLNQLALAFLAEGMGKAELTEDFGKRRGPRGHRGGHGPGGGGRGPKGPGGRGPREGGPEERGPGKWGGPRGFGRGDRDQRDMRPEGAEGGRHGRHGFHRSRWFMGEAPSPNTAPGSPEPTETSFV